MPPDRLKMHQKAFGMGELKRSPDSLAAMGGPTSKGRKEKGRRKGEKGKGRERKQIRPVRDWQSTHTFCQLQSHVTQKLGQK